MTEFLPEPYQPPEALEPPHPPELGRRPYESLVRHATMFANMAGSPLEVSASDVFHYETGVYIRTKLDLLTPAHTNDDFQPRLFTSNDLEALFVDPLSLRGAAPLTVGMLASRIIDAADLPFKSPFQDAEIHVATFNEAALAYMNPNASVTDLTSFPLAAIALALNGYKPDEETGEVMFDQGQWFHFAMLPPQNGDITQALRIREYGEYMTSDDLMRPSSELYQATNALTADNLAWLRKADYDYDFSTAARNALVTKQHVANGGDVYDLEFYEAPHEGYVNGELLTGYVGGDGAEMIQRLIETAMSVGRPLQK